MFFHLIKDGIMSAFNLHLHFPHFVICILFPTPYLPCFCLVLCLIFITEVEVEVYDIFSPLAASLESVYITPKIFGVDHYDTLTYWCKSWKSTFCGVINFPKLSDSRHWINSTLFKKVKQSNFGMYSQSLSNMKRNDEAGNSLCLHFNFSQFLTILWWRSLSYKALSIIGTGWVIVKQ